MAESERDKEEIQARLWATQHRYVYLDVRGANGLESVIGVLGTSDINTFNITPLGKNNGNLNFGITPKTDLGRIQFIEQRFPDFSCHFFVISQSSLKEVSKILDAATLQQISSSSPDQIAEQINKAAGDDIFRLIAQEAFNQHASDIHIEPKSENVVIRFRIDGALHPIMNMPFEKYKILLATLQTKAQMTWGSNRPQGGRVDELLAGTDGSQFELNIRLESIPTLHGEEIIARLLSLDVKYLELDNLSLSDNQRDLLNNVINHLHGMILAVGPTNSGKTSLLYAIINKINVPELKVVTMEDPIEYELKNASQIPVNADEQELFAEKLRAVLRQDPNVIMLGEIRDMDTAKTALQAALTGHLVLSTFHANTASAAVSRLMDMIGQNPLLPSALRLIIAKRLLRRICDHCKETYQPDQSQIETMKLALANLPTNLFKPKTQIVLSRGKGCEVCHGFGYRGRISILEMLQMTPAMEKLLTKGDDQATMHAISEQAVADGMVTLLQEGLLKAMSGETTIEEVYRVVEA